MKDARRSEEFLARIYAEPDDDAARLVYADWLLENRDPRGDFISLSFERERRSLTEDEEKRYVALIQKNQKKWLGPILGATKPRRVYSRGFLSSCEMDSHVSKASPVFGYPAWATVTDLRLGVMAEGLSVVFHPVMSRSLKRLSQVNLDAALKLSHHDAAFAIEEIEITASSEVESIAPTLLQAKSLPQLSRLILPWFNTAGLRALVKRATGFDEA